MSIFSEKSGITRRQFFKGTGMLTVTAIVGGVFAKFGFDVFAASHKYIEERIAGLYTNDQKMAIRKSHENPEVVAIYKEFLTTPNSHKSHELLHTHYLERESY